LAVAGNWRVLLGWLLVAWTSAAIGEELVFRGFLISRVQMLLGASPMAKMLAVLAQAIGFGAGHAYLGVHGMVATAVVGVLYGVTYFATGRNLPALILTHGVTDSLGLIGVYAGAVRW
jgi:CAAX protease family protein